MWKLVDLLSVLILWPQLIARFWGHSRVVCSEDQRQTLIHRANPYPHNEVFQFIHFMVWLPEYRSVFYRRVGRMGKIMSTWLPGQKCLYIRTLASKMGGVYA